MSILPFNIKILLVIFIVFGSAVCKGQNQSEKSKAYEGTLEKIWTPTENDTTSLSLLFKSLKVGDPLLAEVNYKYIQNAIDFAHDQKLINWEAEFYDRLRCAYNVESKKDESEIAHEKSLALFKSNGNIERQVNIMHMLISEYSINDAAEKALNHAYEAIRLCPEVSDESCLGLTYFLMAKTMYNFDEDKKGIEFTKKAVPLLKKTNKIKELAWCYSDYSKYGNYNLEQSIAFMDTSLQLIKNDTTATTEDLVRSYLSRVLMYEKFEKHNEVEKVINYINKELKDKISIHRQQNLAMSSGLIKYNLGKYAESIKILKKSINDQYANINPYLYYDYRLIEMNYDTLHQYDSAYHYHKILDKMEANDRIHQSRMKMKDLEAKYEGEKKGLTIASQNQVIANQNVIQWLGLGATVLLGLLLFQTYRNSQQRRKANEQLIELDKLKTRLYTNITHEFRTPLTVILGMAAQVKKIPLNTLQVVLTLSIKTDSGLWNLSTKCSI